MVQVKREIGRNYFLCISKGIESKTDSSKAGIECYLVTRFSYWVWNSKDEKVQTGFHIPFMLMKCGCRTPDDIREDSSDRLSSVSIWFLLYIGVYIFIVAFILKMIFCLFGVLIVKDVIKINIRKHNVFFKFGEKRKKDGSGNLMTPKIFIFSLAGVIFPLAGVFASSWYEFNVWFF